MAWSEVKKAINSDVSLPLNKAIGEIYDENGNKGYMEYGTVEDKIGLLLPYSFYNGSAVVYNNEIHILGGIGNETKHYKWNGSSWTSVSTLPYSFRYGSAVVYNNEIHILGGNSDGTFTKHYKWNGSSWTSVSTLPYSLYSGSAVVYNNEIHILGGSGNGTKHYKWNGSSWTSVSTLPYSFYRGSAVVYNNEIHILGGNGNETKHYKWDMSMWFNYVIWHKITKAYIHVNGKKIPSFDKGRIKSVQRGKSSAATVTINRVDPSKCIVIIDPATNGSTAVAVSHTLTENTLTLDGLTVVGWQVIEFN